MALTDFGEVFMKLYFTKEGIVVESGGTYHSLGSQDWDTLINADSLAEEVTALVKKVGIKVADHAVSGERLTAPIQSQEVWAAGVTYQRSREARKEEAHDAGGGDFYQRVYDAERPELFFKASSRRVVGPGQGVRIRKDSKWNVPEPELTLVINARGEIVGYTIGNDMSSRDIEGANPLYLPQAKVYDQSAALGPCLLLASPELSGDTKIELKVFRAEEPVYSGITALSQMKRGFEELVGYLYRECTFPEGCYLMTGTGIVPPTTFTLEHGDRIAISVPPIGVLENHVL